MAVVTNAFADELVRSAYPDADLFTACGWCYADAYSNPSWNAIFSLGSTVGDTRLLQFSGTNLSGLGVWDGSSTASFASSPGQGVWFFWAISCDGTSLKGSYSLLTSSTFVTVTKSSPAAHGTQDYMYCATDSGGEYILDPTNDAVGGIAHVKVWDAVLTQSELEQEKWSARPQRLTSLHLWSPLMKDGKDYSGNGRNWTENGTLTWNDGPPIGWGGLPISKVSQPTWGAASLTLIGTGTYSRPVTQFGSGCHDQWTWTFPWPQGAGSTARATVYFVGETTSGCVSFEAQVEAITSGDSDDLDSADSYATANPSGAISMPPTAGMLARADVTLTNIDSVVAGDHVRLRLRRVPVEGNAQAAVDVLGVVVERI